MRSIYFSLQKCVRYVSEDVKNAESWVEETVTRIEAKHSFEQLLVLTENILF